MVTTNPAPRDATLHVCRACGESVAVSDGSEVVSECPECGGRLRDTSVPHD